MFETLKAVVWYLIGDHKKAVRELWEDITSL